MAILTKTNLRKKLRNQVMIRTINPNGEDWTTDGGEIISPSIAKSATQQRDLFDLPEQAALRLIPQEDGLFPGFSQTWRLAQ